ncbi:MAG: double zinc ribbon domain-containing protein [Gemmatimonadaceae bacterium]
MLTRMLPVARALARGALDLLLPRHCAVCERPMDDAEAGVVCGLCWARLELLPHPQCARCGHPIPRGLPSSARCAWCKLLPAYVRAVRSACWVAPDGAGAAVVHALKYAGWRPVARGMAALYA